jgi:hypothetical protein
MQRETTRPLLHRLAVELAERWDQSAKMPAAAPIEEGAPDEIPEPEETEPMLHASTLEEMLGGRRRRQARS